MSRAIIYARCSTDESRQDVEVQLRQLREYCKSNSWEYDEVSEYLSSFRQTPEKLQQIMDLIAQRVYRIFIVYNLDRFSRQKPSKTEKMLSHITDCGCRFIAVQQNLDSDNEMMWYTFKGLWAYFSHQYSQVLSERVKLGMQKKKEEIIKNGYAKSKKSGKKILSIGRPKGSKDKKQRIKKGYYLRKHKFLLK